MRDVEVRLTGWSMGDAMAELRIWLDHNNCVPEDFAISKLPTGELLVSVQFGDEGMAEAFEREFGR
jgi:hypothetical protein